MLINIQVLCDAQINSINEKIIRRVNQEHKKGMKKEACSIISINHTKKLQDYNWFHY